MRGEGATAPSMTGEFPEKQVFEKAEQAASLENKEEKLVTTRQVGGVLQDPRPNAYILSLAPQYVEITVFFWVNYFDQSIS